MIRIPAALKRFLDGQFEELAADPVALARHRDFLGARLAAGLVGLAAFPLWLALGAPGSVFAALTFVWLLAPLPIAAFLARSHRLDAAHLLAAIAMTGLVLWVAMMTGGLTSPMLVWLAVVPAEAALAGKLRTVARAGGVVVAGLAALSFAEVAGLTAGVPQWDWYGPVGTLVAVAALIYLAVVGLRLVVVQRVGEHIVGAGEQRYRLVTEHTADLVTRHHTGGEVEFASPAARSLLGARPADLHGDGLFKLVHVADRPAYLTAVTTAVHDSRTTEVEYRVRSRRAGDGEDAFIWVETRCWPVAAGEADAGVVAVTRDISDRRANEAALAEAREAAEAANAAKTRFLAHISHELRTPLNAILGFSEILGGEGVVTLDPARRADYVRLIRKSSQHLLQVVNDLLDMSKIEAGKLAISPEPVAVKPLVEGCAELLAQQAAERGVTIRTEIAADLPDLVADPRACRQILLNLIANAVKFSNAGGEVAVSAHRFGGTYLFRVADRGIGIAEGDLARLGTPFFQADSAYNRQYQGTGLGLSVVKGLAALHGGDVSIESKLGAGTVVTVKLPSDGAGKADMTTVRSGFAMPVEERKSA